MSNKVERTQKIDPASVPEEKIPDAATVQHRFQKWFPDLSLDVVQRLVIYHTELLKFNRAVNLISASTIRTADSVHFADSVLASRLIAKHILPNMPLVDLGSGNGFPGLVFGAIYSDVKVVLVDRDSRKIEFLKHAIGTLKLANVSAVSTNIEDLKQGSLHNVVARGLAPLHKAMLLGRKQVALGGRFFHLKGDGWATELAGVPSQLFSFWTPSLLGQYKIPDSTSETAVILTEKTAE